MFKKIMIFLVLSVAIFASSSRISQIKTLSSQVSESTYFTGEKKTKVYNIEYVEPDYLRKEIISPTINKGEIFQYENNKRYIYIPLFDEVTEDGNVDEVNNFLSIIKDLKNKDINDENFSKNYYQKKVKKVKYKDIYEIHLLNFKKVNGILIPIKISIYEGDVKLADLKLEDVKINNGLQRKELN